MKRTILPLALSAGLCVSVQADEPLNVLTTTGMIADLVTQVGGECVEVTSLIGSGLDPHAYQASASDVQKLARAELVFYNGLKLEGKLSEVLARFGQRVPVVALAEQIDAEQIIQTDDEYGVDPHVWMSARLWADTLPAMTEALSEQRADCAEQFAQHADTLATQLSALHDWIAESVQSIPEAQRVLFSAHDAFGYFARDYDIRSVGIQGLSTVTEASVADVRATAEQVVELGVPAVFVESSVSTRTVRAVIEAVRQRGHEVQIGSELFSDAMGEPGTYQGTYIGMLYDNTRHIVTELGGQTAPWPAELQEWAEQWNISAGQAAPE